MWGSVSTAMEYALADFAIAKMAGEYGNQELAGNLMARSNAVFQLYDNESKFFRPKNSDNSWMAPFDITTTAGEVIGHDHLGGPGYVEGNAWQYLFFLRQNTDLLAEKMGGYPGLAQRLDECFEKNMFVLWNEPDMHYPFFYNKIEGHEWKTQREVGKAIKKHFGTTPGGLPGNDDAGTLLAWLVFAMMGIYPDAQGITDYLIFKPTFDEVAIGLQNGKKLTIVNHVLDKNDYIKEITFNGKKIDGFKIDHNLIAKGGTLEIK